MCHTCVTLVPHVVQRELLGLCEDLQSADDNPVVDNGLCHGSLGKIYLQLGHRRRPKFTSL